MDKVIPFAKIKNNAKLAMYGKVFLAVAERTEMTIFLVFPYLEVAEKLPHH